MHVYDIAADRYITLLHLPTRHRKGHDVQKQKGSRIIVRPHTAPEVSLSFDAGVLVVPTFDTTATCYNAPNFA